jgi:hypothetical protein
MTISFPSIKALEEPALSHQLDPENNFLIKASIERNVLVDRIEQDWLSSPEFKGRATL